jgi:hypothetical protein
LPLLARVTETTAFSVSTSSAALPVWLSRILVRTFLTANLGGGNMDGFGNFDVTISCCNASNAITSFSFTVTRTGGFSSASQLFEANETGAHFAIHIAPTNGNPTGFAADSATPEPTSMLLLGTGLVTVAFSLRKRRKT